MMETTINKPSSKICLRWQNSGYSVKRTVFQGIDHGTIVRDKDVLETIASIVEFVGFGVPLTQI